MFLHFGLFHCVEKSLYSALEFINSCTFCCLHTLRGPVLINGCKYLINISLFSIKCITSKNTCAPRNLCLNIVFVLFATELLTPLKCPQLRASAHDTVFLKGTSQGRTQDFFIKGGVIKLDAGAAPGCLVWGGAALKNWWGGVGGTVFSLLEKLPDFSLIQFHN